MITKHDEQVRILNIARECIGTPFRHQGRIKGLALDCVGVAIHVAKELQIEYSDVNGYSRIPSNGLLEEAFMNQTCITRIHDLNDMQDGDILLMRFAGEPQHVAIYCKENNSIIHGYEAVGKVCEHILDSVWSKRIKMIYRFNHVV